MEFVIVLAWSHLQHGPIIDGGDEIHAYRMAWSLITTLTLTLTLNIRTLTLTLTLTLAHDSITIDEMTMIDCKCVILTACVSGGCMDGSEHILINTLRVDRSLDDIGVLDSRGSY